jgi:predicted Zn-dependent protease
LTLLFLPDKQINLKAVLILAGSLIGLGVGVHLVHGVQLRRNAGALLEEADRQEKEGQGKQAAATLKQYVGFVPEDNNARARLALLLNKLAARPREKIVAFLALDDVLRRDPNLPELRRKAAALAAELHRFPDALAHLKILQKDGHKDADLLMLRARCEVAEHHYENADRALTEAIALAPDNAQPTADRAELLRQFLKRPEDADKLMDDLVAHHGRDPASRLAAARYYARQDLWDKAQEVLAIALNELAPDDPHVLLLGADVAQARGKTSEARVLLERGLAKHPGHALLALRLARFELERGARDEALDHLQPLIKSLPDEAEDLWRLGGLLLDVGEEPQVETVARRLEEKDAPAAAAYLRIGLQARRGNWGEARLELTRLARRPLSPELAARVQLVLADCYERLGNRDAQKAALARALEGGDWPQARRKLAGCLLTLGKEELAVNELRRAAITLPEARMELARLLLALQLQRPAGERHWEGVEPLLAELAKDKVAGPDVRLLQAEILLAQGKKDEARKLAEAERAQDRKKVGPWLLLARITADEGRASEVPALLDAAVRAVGPRVELFLFQSRFWALKGGKEGPAHLKELEKRLDDLQGADRDRAEVGFAEVAAAAGELSTAQTHWRALAARSPADVRVRLRLLDVALAATDTDEIRRLTDEIRAAEGRGGPLGAYGEAAWRVARAEQGDLAEALSLLKVAGELRPSWTSVLLLEAVVLEKQGRKELALEKYQAAVDRGERRPAVVRRLTQLLYEQHRYTDAQAVLDRLPEQVLNQGDLGKLAAEISLQSLPAEGQETGRKHAWDAARRAVPADSKDYRDYLWLGQAASLARLPKEAEEAFRKARDLNDKSPDAWASLILFLASRDDTKKQATVELADAERRLPAADVPLVLAAGHEALGHLDQAGKYYEAVLAARPEDARVLRAGASFYFRTGQSSRAEPALRKLLTGMKGVSETTVAWARRTLALALAARRDYRRLAEAKQLLDDNVRGFGETPADRQARALVLASHPAHRGEAIKLFEGRTLGRTAPSPDVRLLLANLYEADGDWSGARAQLLALVQAFPKNAAYLVRYIDGQLRHGKPIEALPWLEKLVEIAPGAPETVGLRVLVLKGLERQEEAAKLVKDYASAKDARLDLAGQWMEQLGKTAAAEAYFRVFASTCKEPGASLELAQFLGRDKRVSQALELCAGAWKTCRPELVARSCLFILRSGRPTEEQRRQVERWLDEAVKHEPKRMVLSLLLAELYELDGRQHEAEAVHRRILAADPDNVVALNNLAFLLALRGGDAAEALRLVNLALERAGPLPALLDTRAVIYLKAGQAEDASRDARRAVAAGASPARFFHLAQARFAARDRQGAREAMERARQVGLNEDALHALEVAALQELNRQLR